jgi:hypothetical protein
MLWRLKRLDGGGDGSIGSARVLTLYGHVLDHFVLGMCLNT